jgi:N-hydroxyarylamine O-acetyltransferase
VGTAQQIDATSRSDEGELDLDAYFRRIGYGGPRDPTLRTLRFIHQRHPAGIAFENLNPLLGWPLPLDLESLQRKLVYDGCSPPS